MVDSSDKLRMPVAQEELKTLLTHSSECIPRMRFGINLTHHMGLLSEIQDRNIPILLLANKMDIRGSLTAIQVYYVQGNYMHC